VHRSALFDTWLLSRHADVCAVLRAPCFSVDRSRTDPLRSAPLPSIAAEFADVAHALRRVMMFLDPPEHTRMRWIVAKAFQEAGMRNRRPRIQRIVDELLDAAAEHGEIDFIAEFAYPLPVIVIAEILGLPPSEREAFKRWSDDLGALLDPGLGPEAFQRALNSVRELHQFFADVIAERRTRPRSDLLSVLLAAEDESGKLNDSQLFSTCALLLGAGHLTTTNLMGNALWALWRHPGERRRLEQHPELIRTAVDEFLRYDGPLQATGRVATAAYPIEDKTIQPSDFVVLLLGAANRDPAEFADPDRLDVGRSPNRHVAFGQGIHHCLGRDLARLNTGIAIHALLRRFPEWVVTREEPPRKRNVVSRGFASLPLALGGRHA
jgi:cytochrome P450